MGLDEARVRQYIREQEELERRQGEFDFESPLRPRRGLPDVPAPGRGPPHVTGPLGGAFLIPRPLAVDPYSDRRMSIHCCSNSLGVKYPRDE